MRTQCGHEIPSYASSLKCLRNFLFLKCFWSRRADSNRRPANYELVSAGFQGRPPASTDVYGARVRIAVRFHGRPPRLWASAAVAVTVAVKVAVRGGEPCGTGPAHRNPFWTPDAGSVRRDPGRSAALLAHRVGKARRGGAARISGRGRPVRHPLPGAATLARDLN